MAGPIPEPVAGDDPASGDPFLSLIAGLGSGSPSSGFHGQLCEAICKSVNLDRAVLFQYDVELRRVRPLGGYGIDPSVFGEAYVSPDTATFAREALELDAVVEIGGSQLRAETPAAFLALIEGRRAVCVPVVASGRWLGLLLADRAESAPVLTADERELLLNLGKAVALAMMARRVTRRDERTRMLRHRVDMAREVHDRVSQRLFGVSLALAGDGPLSAEDRARCSAEIEAAMAQLRDTVAGRADQFQPPPKESLAELLRLWQATHLEVDLHFSEADADAIPDHLAGIVRGAVVEALRNATKHASAKRIEVTVRRDDDTLVVEVVNDGVSLGVAAGEAREAGLGAGSDASAHSSQLGLRIVAIEALQSGGLLEFGHRPGDTWSLRLLVPLTDG